MCLLLPTPALAVTSAELVGPGLEAEAVGVMSLRGGMLSYFDGQRRLQTQPVERFVQLRAIEGAEPAWPSGPTIELVDGQRLTGRWAGVTASGALVWEHPVLGSVTVALDRLSQVAGSAGLAREAAGALPGEVLAEDRVVLVNGDVLSGFVTELTAEGLALVPTGAVPGATEAMVLPVDRVRSLRLANPREAFPGAMGVDGEQVVVLRDGSRVVGAGLEIVGDEVRFETRWSATAGAVSVPVSEVARIDLTGSGWRLVALAGCPMEVREGGRVFGRAVGPRVEGEAVWMHAPVTVAFTLPRGAERFSAVAELATGGEVTAAQMAAWADFEVVVRSGGEAGSAVRYRLHGGQPRVRINVPVSGETLTVELDAGVNGPILDRLRLSEAAVLVREAEAEGMSRGGGE